MKPLEAELKIFHLIYAREYREWCMHLKCQVSTQLGPVSAMALAVTPSSIERIYCLHCRDKFPVNDFLWNGTEQLVGS